MVTLFGEWFEPEARLELPIGGGSQAVADALVRGLRRHGGELRCRCPVARILVAGGQARDVRLVSGECITGPQGGGEQRQPLGHGGASGGPRGSTRANRPDKPSGLRCWSRRLAATPA